LFVGVVGVVRCRRRPSPLFLSSPPLRPARHVFQKRILTSLFCVQSPFLDLLFKYQCIRTQKKQKVFYWWVFNASL
jgi:hypothetical protein